MDSKKKSSNKKRSAPKIKDLTAQQRKEALIKQKKCDAIALHIVNTLIDCAVEEDVFIQSLKYMNQCHYQDIVEERAISKMCGYPICPEVIPDMPTKQFHISTKSNKVYDITDRKNYCSNFCYKAGGFIKNQMLTSPLWYRDQEEIPNFKLLPKSEPGVPGEEIDQGIAKIDLNKDENFISVSSFTQDMINDMPEKICDDIKLEKNGKQTDEITDNKNQEEDIVNKNENSENYGTYFHNNLSEISLADILKENMEYFGNNSTHKSNTENCSSSIIIKSENSENSENKLSMKNEISKNSDLKIPECETVKISTKPEKSVKINEKYNKISAVIKNESKNINNSCKIKFDKTLINTKPCSSNKNNNLKVNINCDSSLKSDEKSAVKSILSKNKSEKNQKNKRVSFSLEETNLTEEENLERQENFHGKRKFKPANNQKKSKRNENIISVNIIGEVKEKKNFYEIENVSKNVENQNPENMNVENGGQEKVIENNYKTFDISKSVQENNQNSSKIEENTKINEDTRNAKKENVENYNKTYETSKSMHENSRNDLKIEESQSRKNRLRNSSTFKKAKKTSKIETQSIKSNIDKSFILNKLKNCVRQWLTFDSMIYLYGEDEIKKMVSEKTFNQYLSSKKNSELDSVLKNKYDEISKRLNLMELADRKFDESVTGKKLRPLPKYDDLRQDAEIMDLRIKAFYSGCFEVYETDGDTDNESEKAEDETKLAEDETKLADDEMKLAEGETKIPEGVPAVLPLVESKDIFATRKKIFLSSLSRTVPTICEILKQCPNSLLSDLKKLVNTFHFDANNIVFKYTEWHIVTILLIKLLAIREEHLKNALNSEEGRKFVSTLMQQFDNNCNLDDILIKNLEINSFLQEYLSKNNIIS